MKKDLSELTLIEVTGLLIAKLCVIAVFYYLLRYFIWGEDQMDTLILLITVFIALSTVGIGEIVANMRKCEIAMNVRNCIKCKTEDKTK